MNKLLLTAVIIVGLGIAYYFLYQYNYNEAKDIMSLVMPDYMLIHAQPSNETEEDKKFNDLVEKYIPPEHRYLTENLTESQRNVLSGVLAVGGDGLIVEKIPDLLKDIGSTDIPPDPEHERLMKIVNDTETVRSKLPLIPASSPVQFHVIEETGKGDMMDKIPYTAPGQVSIDIVSGSGDRSVLNNHSDFTPLGWSGTISYDAGTKMKSVSGYGWDRFILDCNPGTTFGVTAQKRSEYGYLEVSISRNEVKPFDMNYIYGESESTYAPYGMVSITTTCPLVGNN